MLPLITTLHLALAVLRANRSGLSGVPLLNTAVGLLFAASPWLARSPLALAAGAVAHIAWFAICERWMTAPGKAAAAPPSAPAQRTPGIAQMARTRPVARPPAPNTFVDLPVLNVVEETPDVRTFRLARPSNWEFVAGQFLAVRVMVEGKEHVRCYSISSPPSARGHIEISVKRIGRVSSTLHAGVHTGSTMHVRPPAGAFVYPSDNDRPLLLVGGGVGITPLMSMLRHAVDTEPTRPVTLVYSVRRVEDVVFHEELWLIRRRNPHVRIVVTLTEGPSSSEGFFFHGRVSATLLTNEVPDLVNANVLMCGPQPMLDAMTELLTSLGVPRAHISFEIFQAAVAASGGAAAQHAVPAAAGPCHLHFDRSGLDTDLTGSQTLLEAAEACGAGIPSLCRAGVCGTCRTKIVSGHVDCPSRMLDERDRQEGFVLACVTHVLGDCTVDA